MKVILFIGHHKVGSSALQTYLAEQAPALLGQGILYPAVEELGFARLVSGPDPTADAWMLPPNVREAHNALAFSMMHDHDGSPIPPLHSDLPPTDEILALIRRQAEMFQPHVMILAAEVFSHFGRLGGGVIPRLTGAFPDADIHLTATLRRVDDYLISWHGQRLRFGHQVRPLPQGALSHYFKTIHFDYRKMLEGWVTALPEAPLTLRTYDQVIVAGGSVQDFMTQAGLPLPQGEEAEPARERRINAGLHRALIEIARQANAGLDRENAAAVFHGLLRLGPVLDLPPSPEVEMFGAEARARLLTRFLPIHQWLSDRVGRPMFDDVDRIGQLCPHAEHEVNRAALAQLTGRHAREFAPVPRAFLARLELSPNYQ